MISMIDRSLVNTYVKYAKELHLEFLKYKKSDSVVCCEISEKSKMERDRYLNAARKLKKESNI